MLYPAASLAEIRAVSFRHHFIARELPESNVGIGASAPADFDRDADLDFAVLNRGDRQLYWLEQKGKDECVRRLIGDLPSAQLGCATTDTDADGWTDMFVGAYWVRNGGKAGGAAV